MLKIILSILILCLAAFFIIDNFCFPNPPEDQLVVAISPFYYSAVSGDSGVDEVTTKGFKERLETERNLGINVIMLDNPIRDNEDAKYWGKKVGAHLVVYGETRKPYLIVESLEENTSSAIYTIGAFENYRKSNFTSAITFFESIKDYENDSLILHYIGNCYYWNNNLNRSLQYFDKAIEIDPQLEEAWYNKGVALADLGRNEEAKEAFEKAHEIDPTIMFKSNLPMIEQIPNKKLKE